MSDAYLDYLERQFASPNHPDEPPRPILMSAVSNEDVRERVGDLTNAAAMLRPTSVIGPFFGLTARDIERSATKLRDGNPLSYRQEVAKRALDLLLAVPAMIIIALVTPIIAMLIHIDSPGPVFYRQARVGRGGRTFLMLKFRTMRLDASDHLIAVAALADGEGSGGVLFKLRADPRITRVGRVLRKYSLDELPQFLNVLLGQMSIVGPRPPLPIEAESRRPLTVQPGITGIWTLSSAYPTWEESVRLDEAYAASWTLRGDFAILGWTLRAILSPRGHY